MITYKSADIVIIDIPFTDEIGSKQRPALVIFDDGDEDIVLSRITSIFRSHKPYDYEIKDISSTGLPVKSYIRLSKIFTIEKTKVKKNIGHLAVEDIQSINNLLNKIFKLPVN